MNVVGLNFGHDAGVSLVRDGVFVRHWEKERHCRVKHAMGLRRADIEAALEYFAIALEQIDFVAITTTQFVPIMLYDGVSIVFKSELLISPENSIMKRTQPSVFYQTF